MAENRELHTFYMQNPRLSDHHVRIIDANYVPRGKVKRSTPIARGPFGKPERRFDRIWVDFRAQKRGPHKAPQIKIIKVTSPSSRPTEHQEGA